MHPLTDIEWTSTWSVSRYQPSRSSAHRETRTGNLYKSQKLLESAAGAPRSWNWASPRHAMLLAVYVTRTSISKIFGILSRVECKIRNYIVVEAVLVMWHLYVVLSSSNLLWQSMVSYPAILFWWYSCFLITYCTDWQGNPQVIWASAAI